MARPRKKKRTHVGAVQPGVKTASNLSNRSLTQSPKSMVIRMGAGNVGSGISQLVKDLRAVMEPGTASKLSERKSNKLRDYITMAGPLGVTHLLLFTRSETTGNTNLRITLTPRGPTLTFRVDNYSLAKDVKRPMKHHKEDPKAALHPPLLVMNNFASKEVDPEVPKHLESLVTSVFQSLFPPINPQATPLSTIRRVMLLDRVPADKYSISLRHYSITAKRAELSSQLRRLNAAEKMLLNRSKSSSKNVPDLSRMDDVADYLLNPAGAGAYTSDSSVPGSDAEVEMQAAAEVRANRRHRNAPPPQDTGDLFATRPQNSVTSAATTASRVEKRIIKLHELGPRMTLRLLKVEEGVCAGKVMWHEYITKTPQEQREQEVEWGRRKKEKEERRRVQRENIKRKRAEREKERRAGKVEDGGEGEESEGLVSEVASDDLSAYEDALWESEGDEAML